MKLRILRKCTIWLLCGTALLSGCAKKLWPSDQGFPDREIVFEYPSTAAEPGNLGFIRPDGTEFITRTVEPRLPAKASMPTWSPDGKFIAFQTDALSNSQRVVSHEGELSGKCRKWGWNVERNWVTEEGDLLFVFTDETSEHPSIVLGNPRSCKVHLTLLEATDIAGGGFIEYPNLSLQGWLALSRVFTEDFPARAEIIVVEPGSREVQVVGQGRAPVWSRSGEWLAYTALDGIYVVRKEGTETHRVVDIDSRSESYPGTSVGIGWLIGFPTPSWSPDGKWLVYHRMTTAGSAIYKVNVESGVETEIFQGGVYPDWRWDLAPASE